MWYATFDYFPKVDVYTIAPLNKYTPDISYYKPLIFFLTKDARILSCLVEYY